MMRPTATPMAAARRSRPRSTRTRIRSSPRSVDASSASRLRARQGRVAAYDEALAGEVGTADLGEVALVEEAQLERALLDQTADGGRPQGADPVDAAALPEALDARAGEHAPIARQHEVLQAEASLERIEPVLQGGRIGGVPREGLDAEGPSLRVEHEAEHDLLAVGPMVPAVAVGPRAGRRDR